MKSKKFSLFILPFLILSLVSILHSRDGKLIGKIGSVNSSTKEIVINMEGIVPLKMGEQVYVRIGNDIAVMESTFPMQTTSKCKLRKNYTKYLNKIENGMNVYLYDKTMMVDNTGFNDVKENKESVYKKRIGHHDLTGEWECTIPSNRFRIKIIWDADRKRYEGYLTQNGQDSLSVGFTTGELIYEAYLTDNPDILREMCKLRSPGCCLLAIPHGAESWEQGNVNMAQWESGDYGIFYLSNAFVRIRHDKTVPDGSKGVKHKPAPGK